MTPQQILESLIRFCIEKECSDIHLCVDSYPVIRNKHGAIEFLKSISFSHRPEESIVFSILGKDVIKQIALDILGYQGMDTLTEKGEVDSAYEYKKTYRFRINAYKDINGINIAMRYIPNIIPTLEDLYFSPIVYEMLKKQKGLILVTGPTGSGKSTNLAAMIEYINEQFQKHIITIEDPIEFHFTNKKSMIHQRQVGIHTTSFLHAIKAAMREDPDVIVVGEMRDPETIRSVLTFAETGHLVLSTLHTNDTVQSIDRIIDVFPGNQQPQIRMQLALSLIGIISQRLLPCIDNTKRVPAREILINTDAVRNLIITGKTHQIYSVIEVSSKQGMVLMDQYLLFLYKKGFIGKDVLFSHSRDKEGIELLLRE